MQPGVSHRSFGGNCATVHRSRFRRRSASYTRAPNPPRAGTSTTGEPHAPLGAFHRHQRHPEPRRAGHVRHRALAGMDALGPLREEPERRTPRSGHPGPVHAKGTPDCTWTVSESVPARSFTWRTKVRGAATTTGHVIEPAPSGAPVTLSIEIGGIAAALLKIIGRASAKNCASKPRASR